MRRVVATFCLGAVALLVAVGAVAPFAGAQNTATETDIGSGLRIQGATITGPCNPPKRELNSPQAAAFLQSWLPNAIFGKPTVQDPPSALPVCRVSVRYRVVDKQFPPMQVDYASDGKTAWVAMPRQDLWPGVFVSVHRWTVALPRAVAAFAGKVKPIPVATGPDVTAPSTSTPATKGLADPPTGKSSSDGSGALWIIVAIVGGIGLLGTGYVVVRRRGVARSGA